MKWSISERTKTAMENTTRHDTPDHKARQLIHKKSIDPHSVSTHANQSDFKFISHNNCGKH